MHHWIRLVGEDHRLTVLMMERHLCLSEWYIERRSYISRLPISIFHFIWLTNRIGRKKAKAINPLTLDLVDFEDSETASFVGISSSSITPFIYSLAFVFVDCSLVPSSPPSSEPTKRVEKKISYRAKKTLENILESTLVLFDWFGEHPLGDLCIWFLWFECWLTFLIDLKVTQIVIFSRVFFFCEHPIFKNWWCVMFVDWLGYVWFLLFLFFSFLYQENGFETILILIDQSECCWIL